MKESFDYKEVPEGYAHCLNTQCPCSSDCLRYKIGAIVSDDTTHIKVVNPKYVKKQKECPYFQPDELVCYAYGISHLYDGLLHTTYIKIKKALREYFGHNAYYRIYNKIYPVKAKDQAFIRELFQKEGVEFEPVFDEYIERYDFFSSEE